MHLGFLDYAHYIITVRFLGLESFHQKYNIRAITFYVSSSYLSIYPSSRGGLVSDLSNTNTNYK